MDEMTITKRCAEAMGYFRPQRTPGVNFMGVWACLKEHDPNDDGGVILFDPLHDDAQCFALVKRFDMKITKQPRYSTWRAVVYHAEGQVLSAATNADLNRAICECVANLQQSKEKP